jgi:hypothetical protein
MLNFNSNEVLSLEDEEVAVVDEAEGAGDVCVGVEEGVEEGIEVGPLVESPTRNVSPAIGPTTPMIVSN